VKCGREPLRSKEEIDKERRCAAVADQLSALKSQYQKRRSDYDFKISHPLDAQMEECELHWREWVCLERGASNAKEWNESGEEVKRKLDLEWEELKKLDQQISLLTQSNCS
jgi:hypothetical protein